MKFSDIQLTDKKLWGQFQTVWNNGDYDTALAMLNNTQLNKKVLSAQALNELTDKIV